MMRMLRVLRCSLYHEHALSRKENKQKEQGERIGVINFKGMTSKTRIACLKQPSITSQRVSKLMPNEYVIVIEEMEAGSDQWYKLKADPGMQRQEGWVLASYVTIETVEQ